MPPKKPTPCIPPGSSIVQASSVPYRAPSPVGYSPWRVPTSTRWPKWAQVVDHHTLTDRSVEGSLPVSEQGIFSSRFLGRIEMILKESSVNPVENPYSFQTIHPILPDYSEGNLSCFSMTKCADRHCTICCLWTFYDFLMCSHSQNTPLKLWPGRSHGLG